MNKLQQIVAYLCLEYPHKQELSNARTTKLVYLADWFASLLNKKQMTSIDWVFNHYGPYVDDVFDAVQSSPSFDVNASTTPYNTEKLVFSYNSSSKEDFDDLTAKEMLILDFVIDKAEKLYFNDFIDYVYSTYPVKASERYSKLDLPVLAAEYQSKKAAKQTIEVV